VKCTPQTKFQQLLNTSCFTGSVSLVLPTHDGQWRTVLGPKAK